MTPLAIHDAAIPFSLPGVDGQDHSLDGLRDKPVLVIFWSCNHCPYVQAYENRLMDLQRELADRAVQLVAINSNSAESHPADAFDRMVERAQQRGFNYLYLHDESQDIARAYGAQRTPECFVFDADRRLRYHGGIDDSWDNPGAVTKRPLRDAIEAVLSGKDPNPTETPAVGCTIKWRG